MRAVLLLTASRQPYQRAGFPIGAAGAPTRIEHGDDRLDHIGFEKLLRDPVVAMAMEIEVDGATRVVKISEADRRAALDGEGGGLEAKLQEVLAQLEAERIEKELQPASGVEGETGADASAPVDLSISGGAPVVTGASQSLPGTGTSSADEPGQPREQADASNGAAASDADEGKQPAETALPPVAEPDAASEKAPSVAPTAEKPAKSTKPTRATQTRA